MQGLTLGPGGRGRPPIPLAVDEWNVWYRATGGPTEPKDRPLEEVYDLQDALVVAMHLNAFIRHASTVRMANLAQLVNVIAPIVTGPDGLLLQTIFHPFELFSRTAGSVALDAWWDGDTFTGGDYAGVRTLDVSSSVDRSERRLSVHVVNRHPSDVLEVEIELDGGTFAGSLEVITITGEHLKTTNTFASPNAVTPTEQQLDIPTGDRYRHSLPARSVTGLGFAV
jgi:alpha-N-arabinofuranosidase